MKAGELGSGGDTMAAAFRAAHGLEASGEVVQLPGVIAEIANEVGQHLFETIGVGGVGDATCRSGAQHPPEASQSSRMWVGAPGHLKKTIGACQNRLHVLHGRQHY